MPRPPLTEDEINRRLAERGVEIVSGTYMGIQKSAEWYCHKCGYVWEAHAESVLRKRYVEVCPECSKIKGSEDEFALLDSYNLNQEWDYETDLPPHH